MTISEDLMKSSALIEIEHKISLLENHIHNVLLGHAFHNMDYTNIHTITVNKLKEHIPGINNIKHLKQMLESLVDTKVEYNIFEKDKIDIWGKYSLLASVRLDKFNRILTYSFPPDLLPGLSHPKLYAKINLKLQREYNGTKYGWFLYELCFDYKGVGRTPTKTIPFIKKYFGIASDKYKNYKDFNKRVLIPAIYEVNLQTPLYLTPEFIKRGNTISGIIFHIIPNPDYVPPLINVTPEADKQLTVDDRVILLHTMNVSDKKIKTLIKEYDLKQIQEVCQVYKEANKTAIKSIDSWITIALKENWQSKATESQRLSIISLEADKKEVEAKADKEKELYLSGDSEKWFDYLLSIQQEYDKIEYNSLNAKKQAEFRKAILYIRKEYDDFKLIPFTEKVVNFALLDALQK